MPFHSTHWFHHPVYNFIFFSRAEIENQVKKDNLSMPEKRRWLLSSCFHLSLLWCQRFIITYSFRRDAEDRGKLVTVIVLLIWKLIFHSHSIWNTSLFASEWSGQCARSLGSEMVLNSKLFLRKGIRQNSDKSSKRARVTSANCANKDAEIQGCGGAVSLRPSKYFLVFALPPLLFCSQFLFLLFRSHWQY